MAVFLFESEMPQWQQQAVLMDGRQRTRVSLDGNA